MSSTEPMSADLPRDCPRAAAWRNLACWATAQRLATHKSRHGERYRTAGRVLQERADRSVLAYVTGGSNAARLAPAKRDRSLQIVDSADSHTPGFDVAIERDKHLDFTDDLIKIDILVVPLGTLGKIKFPKIASFINNAVWLIML